MASSDPAQRRLIAKVAANARWSKAGARKRQALKVEFARYRQAVEAVDPEGRMRPQELRQAVAAYERERAARLSLRKAQSHGQ